MNYPADFSKSFKQFDFFLSVIFILIMNIWVNNPITKCLSKPSCRNVSLLIFLPGSPPQPLAMSELHHETTTKVNFLEVLPVPWEKLSPTIMRDHSTTVRCESEPQFFEFRNICFFDLLHRMISDIILV